jgi:hypothetical protein
MVWCIPVNCEKGAVGGGAFLPFTESLLFWGLVPSGASCVGRMNANRTAAIMRAIVVYDIMVLLKDVFLFGWCV